MENIEIESIGKLKPHPDVPDEWLISEPVPISFFNGKELQFTLNGDLKSDKSFLSDANRTIKNFLAKTGNDKLNLSNQIYKYYRAIQDYHDSELFGAEPLKLNNEREIWNYVHPYEIYICRNAEPDADMYLQIQCDCDWEEEHGLQLVFKNGSELTRVSHIDYNPVE
ncbi:MAG TPA: hypothetical protein VGB68_10730 [Pyrinomonadaceae bacterium]|jgi:vacuolar-type H+-ATPase subunit B/Vma2